MEYCIFCKRRTNHQSIECWYKHKTPSRIERTQQETRTFKRIYTPFANTSRRKDLRTRIKVKHANEGPQERVVKFTSNSTFDTIKTPSPKQKETWPPLQIEKKKETEEEIVILQERSAKLKTSTLSLPLPIQDVESTAEYQNLKTQNTKLKKELDISRKQHCIAIVERDEYKRILDFHMRRMYSTPSQNNPYQTNIVKK